MGVFEQFPYANMHEMNLEWLLKKMKELDHAMETFKATESLKFADPIIWDITTQYEKSTIVLDPTGNAYLSLQAVPAGVQLNNEEYWLEIFNFTDYTRTANQNLTIHTETNTTRATATYQVDAWLIWNDVLYRVTSPIAIDDALIVAPAAGSNIVHFTVEDFIKAFITYATGLINQYKNDIDASELAYRQQLAQDIADTTASLQAQLDAVIAGATVDSEVIDARVGWNNITYSTLGTAIRTQIDIVASAIEEIQNNRLSYFITNNEYINNTDGSFTSYVDWDRTGYIDISKIEMLFVQNGASSIYNAFYDENKNFISSFTVNTTKTAMLKPTNAYYVAFSGTRASMNALDVTYLSKTEYNDKYVGPDSLIHIINDESDFYSGLFIHGNLASSTGRPNDTASGSRIISRSRYLISPYGLNIITKDNTSRARLFTIVNNTASNWDNRCFIPANTPFQVVLTHNQNSSTDVPVDTIYNLFEFKLIKGIELKDYKLTKLSYRRTNGYNYSDNQYIACSGIIKLSDEAIFVKTNSGFLHSDLILDENYNVLNWDTADWDLQPQYHAGSGYLVVLFKHYEDIPILESEYDNLQIIRSADYASEINIKSFSKDGFNTGMSASATLYPPCSYAAFNAARSNKFNRILLHVQKTSDGVFVCYHDRDIEYTATNLDGTPITTPVYIDSSTYNQLLNYDYGWKSGTEYRGTQILTMEEAISYCKKIGLQVYIELVVELPDNDCYSIIDLAKSYGLEKIGFYSANFVRQQRIHTRYPDVDLMVYAATDSIISTNINTMASLVGDNNTVYNYIFYTDTISNAGIDMLRQNGIKLMVQTENIMNEPKSVQDILTRYPYTSAIVSKYKPAYIDTLM